MTILISDNLSKSFGARPIFKSVTFSVGQGERMCVVGRNGEGKTTLLRVLAGELEQDEGLIRCREEILQLPLTGRPGLPGTVMRDAIGAPDISDPPSS